MRSRLRHHQRGLSFVTLVVVLFFVVIIAIFGLKFIPSFLEFRAAKSAIEAIAREKQNGSPADIRRAFEARSAIDDINSVKAPDLEITKEGGAIVISFSYRKEVQLSKNVGVYIDYQASAGGQ